MSDYLRTDHEFIGKRCIKGLCIPQFLCTPEITARPGDCHDQASAVLLIRVKRQRTGSSVSVQGQASAVLLIRVRRQRTGSGVSVQGQDMAYRVRQWRTGSGNGVQGQAMAYRVRRQRTGSGVSVQGQASAQKKTAHNGPCK